MPASLLHRKDRIIIATIEEIDRHGITSFSTREIANKVGVTDAAIFKHFKTKTDLIEAVLNHYSQYDLALFEGAELLKRGPRETLVYIIETYARYYESYPSITSIEQAFDTLRNDPILGVQVKEIILKREKFLLKKLVESKAVGELYQDLDTELLTEIISGSIHGLCLKWRISNYGFSLSERIVKTINMLLDAFTLKEVE